MPSFRDSLQAFNIFKAHLFVFDVFLGFFERINLSMNSPFTRSPNLCLTSELVVASGSAPISADLLSPVN